MPSAHSGDFQESSKPDPIVVHSNELFEASQSIELSHSTLLQSTGTVVLNTLCGTLIELLASLAKGVGILTGVIDPKSWKNGRSFHEDTFDALPVDENKGGVTSAEFDRWMARRDAHRARIRRDPAPFEPSDAHVDVLVLEDWLDGEVSDLYIEAYMREHANCKDCQAAYEHYKHLKTTSLLYRR